MPVDFQLIHPMALLFSLLTPPPSHFGEKLSLVYANVIPIAIDIWKIDIICINNCILMPMSMLTVFDSIADCYRYKNSRRTQLN